MTVWQQGALRPVVGAEVEALIEAADLCMVHYKRHRPLAGGLIMECEFTQRLESLSPRRVERSQLLLPRRGKLPRALQQPQF